LLVTAASWLRRTMPLIMVWTSLFLFVRLLAAMLVDLKYGDRWRLIDLWNNLCVVGSWCLGFESYTMGLVGTTDRHRSKPCPPGSLRVMPDLLEPADPRGGDRALIDAPFSREPTASAGPALAAGSRLTRRARSSCSTMSRNGTAR